MADDSAMVVGAVNQASNDIQDMLIDVDDDISKNLKEMSGLSDAKEDPAAQLKIITELLTGISDALGIKESAQAADPSSGQAAALAGVSIDDDKDNKKKDDDDVPGKEKPKLSDVAKLGGKAGMGSILVYNKLDEIQTMLKLYFKKGKDDGKGSDKGAKKDKEEKSGGGFSFKTLGADMKSIAAGLKEFAKASMILALIPKKIANKGLDFFINFMDRYLSMLNKFKKNLKDVTKFNSSILTLSKGLKSFAGACWILMISIPAMALATAVGLPLISAFLSAIIALMKNVKKEMQNFYIFTQACILLGISFIIMAVAFMAMALTLKYIPKALVGLALSIVIFTLVAVLAYFLGTTVLPLMAVFAFACILMGVAFILMSLAIKILADFKPDWNNVNKGLEEIVHLVIAIAKMAGWLILGAIAVVLLAVFGVGFFVAMVGLVAGVLFAWILGMMPVEEIVGKLFASGEDGDGAVIQLIKAIGVNIGWILLGTVAVVLLSAFSVLFMVSMLLLMFGFMAAKKIHKILQEDPSLITDLFDKGGAVDQLTKRLSASIGFFLLGTLSLAFGVAFSLEFMIFSLALLVGVKAMVEIKKSINDLGGSTSIADMAKKIKDVTMGLLLGVIGMDYTPGQSISMGTMMKIGESAKTMKKIAKQVKEAITPAAQAIRSMEKIAKSVKVMHEALQGVDKEFIELIFNGISTIMDSLAEVAEAFKDKSAKTVKAIGECLLNVVGALDKIVDLVIKLKDGIPEDQIEAATTAMLSICEHLFGVGRKFDWTSPPERYTLVDTLSALSSVELTDGSVKAAEAIEPLMKGIGACVEVVDVLSDPERFSSEKMELGINNLNAFIGLIQYGVVPMIKALSEQIPDGGYQTIENSKKVWFIETKSSTTVKTTKSVMEMMKGLIDSGFVSTVKTLFSGIAQAIDYLSGIPVTSLDAILKFLGSDVITIMNGTKTFSDALDILNSAFVPKGPSLSSIVKGNFTGTGPDTIDVKFNRLADALIKFGSVDFQAGANGLMTIANASKGLSDSADAIDRMASALGAIGNSEGKVNSVFDRIFKAKEYLTSQFNDINTAAGESIAAHVQTMAGIMQEWNENGIPLRGKVTVDEETAEQKIVPDEVGNGVVKGKK